MYPTMRVLSAIITCHMWHIFHWNFQNRNSIRKVHKTANFMLSMCSSSITFQCLHFMLCFCLLTIVWRFYLLKRLSACFFTSANLVDQNKEKPLWCCLYAYIISIEMWSQVFWEMLCALEVIDTRLQSTPHIQCNRSFDQNIGRHFSKVYNMMHFIHVLLFFHGLDYLASSTLTWHFYLLFSVAWYENLFLFIRGTGNWLFLHASISNYHWWAWQSVCGILVYWCCVYTVLQENYKSTEQLNWSRTMKRE